MAKLTTAEFIEAIKELSVLELNELVKSSVFKGFKGYDPILKSSVP